MKLLLTAAFLFVASALPNPEWVQYKEKYKKVYTSEQEDLARYNQYLKTKNMIEEHNIRFEKGETSYWMGINHFSDWFADEINHMLGLRHNETRPRGKPFELPPGTPVPDSINWVEKGAVTRVKDQGQCGSCYAFSAVGALEGLMFTTNKTITDLSEQEILDCDTRNEGCRGGFQTNCFEYVMKRHGIDTNASYPYKAVPQQTCSADRGVIGATCTGYVTPADEEQLKEAVGTMGPVSTSFAVDESFVSYKGGVFDGSCSIMINHGMVAVGYDKDKESGKDYWLVKNSWGVDWGEKGYVRIIRNVDQCGIGEFNSIPTYSSKN